MTSKTNLSASEIDRIFQKTRGGVIPVSNIPMAASSNTNLEPNMYGVTRDDTKETIRKSRSKVLSRERKVNGAMAQGNGITYRAGCSGGQNTNFNAPRDVDKVQRVEDNTGHKVSLKKELGISGAGTRKTVWKDFLKSVKTITPELKLKEAMKIASYMKNNNMYKMDDVNIQNVTMVWEKIK